MGLNVNRHRISGGLCFMEAMMSWYRLDRAVNCMRHFGRWTVMWSYIRSKAHIMETDSFGR